MKHRHPLLAALTNLKFVALLCAPIFFGITMLAATTSPAPAKEQPAAGTNPLLVESSLQYHYPPFDKIKNEDYAPAYTQAMAEQLKEVEVIANNPEAPTFDNTMVALEKAGL
ncbi:MAG: dipeptidyl carboxypeptidase II, partial [Chthoniobacterales bacterium]